MIKRRFEQRKVDRCFLAQIAIIKTRPYARTDERTSALIESLRSDYRLPFHASLFSDSDFYQLKKIPSYHFF